MCNADEIYFTASATESANTAFDRFSPCMEEDTRREVPHIIVSEIEHSAVLESASQLEAEGVRITRVPLTRGSCTSPATFVKR